MRRAFTLIELLVVIAIIAILAAILFPVFSRAKLAAVQTQALAQMKQLALASSMYSDSNDDYFAMASARPLTGATDPEIWPPAMLPFVKNKQLFVAPQSDGKFAENWAGRRNQSIGYSDATGVDPNSTAQAGAAPAGTEGFTTAASQSIMEEPVKVGLFAVTPNSLNGKERGYVFNPYNGTNSPDGVYAKGLPLIGDVNVCTTRYKGVDYTTLSAGQLKPIYARYGGDGTGNGQTPVIFADSHAKNYSANALNSYGTVTWRFR